MSEELEVINNLGQTIRDIIDDYSTGHNLPVALIVGLLHVIAYEIIEHNSIYEAIEDEDDDIDWEPA